MAAGQVERCNLQVAPVDVALVQRHTTIDCNLLRGAAAHVVVLAVHGGDGAVNRLAGKIRRAVLGIVADSPDAGARLHSGLVAGGIVRWDEVGNIIHREHGVLVERIGLVAGDFLSILLRKNATVHRHRLGGDAAGRHSTVLRSFRSFIIDTPLRGSQATFADRNHFTFQRGAQLRDKLLLRTGERLPGGIVARGVD